MPAYAALLRAVNLGSHNKVSMSDLKALVARLGHTDAQSLLQSGNLVFKCKAAATAKLESGLEAASVKHLKLETDYFVRSSADWKALIQANPFPEEAERDPGHLIVLFLRNAPNEAAVVALQRAIKGREVVRAVGRQAYIVYPDGVGQSRLTMAMIEKHLGSRGTGRNWNTVLKLGAALEALGRPG